MKPTPHMIEAGAETTSSDLLDAAHTKTAEGDEGMSDKIDIPIQHQEFCKSVARLAVKHGLYKFSGSFTPGFGDPWDAEIQFSWDAGRHEEGVDKLFISSTIRVWTRLSPPKETKG